MLAAVFFLVTVLVAVYLQLNPIIKREVSVCSKAEADKWALFGVSFYQGECYFSEDYATATRSFLKAADSAGAYVKAMKVTEADWTNVAIIPGAKDKFLLHASGTHGGEGYAGSAVQIAVLQGLAQPSAQEYMAANKDNVPTMVFIHGMNPYGFANNRRVNENNVDLNRNFLTAEQFEAFQKRDPNYSGYVDMDFMLNPTSKPSQFELVNDAYAYLLSATALFKHGYVAVKRALVAGNYHKATGKISN
jgi:hypothetical protein